MNLSDTPLEQLGSAAHGHYKAASKAQDKAEQQILSAGIYLKEAKERIALRRDMNFAEFLLNHCPIGKSRAYEVIAIADGRKTVDEVREETNLRKQTYRETVRSRTDAPTNPNHEGSEDAQRHQLRGSHSSLRGDQEDNGVPAHEGQRPKIRSAQEEADEAHELLLNSIILKIRKLDSRKLLQLKEHLSLRAN